MDGYRENGWGREGARMDRERERDKHITSCQS